jgi:hypothetical protein
VCVIHCILTLRKCVVASSCFCGSVDRIISSHCGIFCNRCARLLSNAPRASPAGPGGCMTAVSASCRHNTTNSNLHVLPLTLSFVSVVISPLASPCEYANHALGTKESVHIITTATRAQERAFFRLCDHARPHRHTPQVLSVLYIQLPLWCHMYTTTNSKQTRIVTFSVVWKRDLNAPIPLGLQLPLTPPV